MLKYEETVLEKMIQKERWSPVSPKKKKKKKKSLALHLIFHHFSPFNYSLSVVL